VSVAIDLDAAMAGMAAWEASLLASATLEVRVDVFATVFDEPASRLIRVLAHRADCDPPIEAEVR
jgi:hypothetical protein